jgi:predicted amidohydrolase
MTRSLKVALLHLAPELGGLDGNRALIESGTRVAAELGAERVVSGELVVPGYRFEGRIGTDWIDAQPGVWMRRLAELSANLGVVSFISHPERDATNGHLFNSLFVIGRDGRILGRHRKLPAAKAGRARANQVARCQSTASTSGCSSVPTPTTRSRRSVCAMQARS